MSHSEGKARGKAKGIRGKASARRRGKGREERRRRRKREEREERNWEGKKGMKRMKKKVVAMVTLAMFLVTLLPMAAFAGTEDALTVTNKTEVTVNEKVIIEATTDGDRADNVEIWVEDVDGNVVKNATFGQDSTVWAQKDGVVSGYLVDGQDFYVTIPVAGEYTVQAGKYVETKVPGTTEVEKEFVKFAPTEVITVTGTTVTDITAVVNGGAKILKDQMNGYEPIKVSVDVKPDTGLNGEKLVIDNSYNGITVVDKDGNEIDSIALDTNGDATFYITVEEYVAGGAYELGLSCNGFDATASFEVEGDEEDPKVATTIEAVNNDVVVNRDEPESFKKVQLEVRDQNGDLMNPVNEPIMANGGKHDTYVNIKKQPAKSTSEKLEDSDIVLGWDKDTEKLYLNAANKTYKAGDYEIEFVLKNGEKATVSFTVGKFNAKDVQDLVIKSNDYTIPVTIDDKDGTVKIDPVKYDVYQVDGNGIEKEISNADLAFVPAVNEVTVKFTADDFTAAYTGDVEDIIGTEVTITAFDKSSKLLASQEYTFVEKAAMPGVADNKLTFDNEEGKVLKHNPVIAELVNAEGKKITDGTVTYAVNQKPLKVSDKDAKVIIKDNGNGKFSVYSDKAVTVDVQVLAWYEKDGYKAVYGETLTYTIGGSAVEDPTVNTSIVMTYGSTEMVVNNKVVDMKDAAPFAQDNRTFVPFRALGEALGATVEYKAEDKTVTYELQGTKIVMTLGEKTYTVNGAEKTMDVAPFAKDNRTYVPVRFVGEALGFEVTALQNGNGEYVAVAFTK